MAISSPGIGSSLDVNSIITQLMALEQRPLTLLGIKEARLQSRLSAIGQVKGVLSSIQSGLAGLKDASRFSSFKGASSDATVTSVTASTFAEQILIEGILSGRPIAASVRNRRDPTPLPPNRFCRRRPIWV